MEINPDDIAKGNISRERKFGLPDWMVNNIERLNFGTDIEQYACSPPESEGFLNDYPDSFEYLQKKDTDTLISKQTCTDESIEKSSESDVHMNKLPQSPELTSIDSMLVLNPILKSIQLEDVYSSPDSTPCSTPQPSPIVRRKISNPGDTVLSNPGRWFYTGKLKKLDKNGKELPLNAKSISNKKNSDSCKNNVNRSAESFMESKNNGLKLVISNFDLNAVSPTSW